VIAAAVNGFVAPPMIAQLLLLSNDPCVTGRHRNGRLLNVLGWATAGLTAVAAAGLLISFL
jgi:Mn2+/Fe2+ NRAMP family transporter